MSEKNRDRLIEGILYYKEAIRNSDDKEYIEKCQKKIEEFSNQLTLNHIDDSFIITYLNISEQTYINKEFTEKELIRYLDTLYLQRIETGFVEACFSYLSNLNK